ncbi:DUF2795 domain-containing protein [Polymorphospora rubra]|uniref:DUF2795 domain-containing protein n=1 Tax=Polymorphospora rubra TaxID=338584 RepID=UPI0033C18A35
MTADLSAARPYLDGLEFPASRQEMIRHALRNGADRPVLDLLRTLPDTDYKTSGEFTDLPDRP